MGTQGHLKCTPLLVSTLKPIRENIFVKSPTHNTITHRRLSLPIIYATAPKREKDAKKRVVVTGMGVVSVFGSEVDTFYEKLLAGENGVVPIDKFDASEFPTRFGGQIHGFNSDGYVDSKQGRRFDDYQRYCLVAGKKAVEHAALSAHALTKVCHSVIHRSLVSCVEEFV